MGVSQFKVDSHTHGLAAEAGWGQ